MLCSKAYKLVLYKEKEATNLESPILWLFDLETSNLSPSSSGRPLVQSKQTQTDQRPQWFTILFSLDTDRDVDRKEVLSLELSKVKISVQK